MNMIWDKKSNRKVRGLNQLERKLRNLPKVNANKALEKKLLATISVEKTNAAETYRLRWYVRRLNFEISVAAAIFGIVLILFMNQFFSPAGAFSAELDDTSLCHTLYSQSSFWNDQNSYYSIKALQLDFNFPVIDQNICR